MADQELTNMTAASTLDGTEVTYVVQADADRKATIAQIRAASLPLAGGAMTGDIVLAGAPSAANHPATKTYVDTALTTKAASVHTHVTGDVSGLDAALAGKSATGHTHAASDIATGTVATARLGSGTADGTTFLRGDQTWAAPAGGGLSGLTTGNIPYADSATTLAEGPIYRCAAQRIGFGGTTDSFPGMRWATEFCVDFVRAAAGAFIGVNAAYFQFGNLSKLQNVSNGVVKVTTDADALGGIEVGTLTWNDGTQWTVTLGANDTGGSGKRALVVDNV